MLGLRVTTETYAETPTIVRRWRVTNEYNTFDSYGDPYGFCSALDNYAVRDSFKERVFTIYSDGTGTFTYKWYRNLYDGSNGQLVEKQLFNANVVIYNAVYNAAANCIDGNWDETDNLLYYKCH